MKKMIQQLIKQKMKNLTPSELISYGKQYGFHLTTAEADEIIRYVQKRNLDPFKEEDRLRLLKKIAKIKDEQTAKKANQLFKDMIKQYGMEDLF